MTASGSVQNVYERAKQIVVEGSLGALFSAIQQVTVGQFCERIRIERQAFPVSESLRETSIRLYKEGGVRKFYEGLQWSLWTQCSKNALRWAMLAKIDRCYADYLPNAWKKDYPSLQPFCVGGSMAVVETSLVTVTELMKTLHMTSSLNQKPKMLQIIRTRGVAALYQSWSVVLIRNSVAWIAYLVTPLKLYSFFAKPGESTITQDLAINGLSGGLNVLMITPFDMIKTQLQKENALKVQNFLHAVQKIYRLYGVQVFWKGAGIKMIHSVCYAAIMLTAMKRFGVYETNRSSQK